MYMLCRQTDPANGLGALCLGAEAIVPVFYADIVEGFVQAGVPRERLGFLRFISSVMTAMPTPCATSWRGWSPTIRRRWSRWSARARPRSMRVYACSTV